MDVVKSKNKVPIRLTAERWLHISESHEDIGGVDIVAKEIVKEEVLKELFKATTHLLKLPIGKIWIDYDKEADVLYISFKRPQKSTDSEMLKNGVLLRYKDNEIVGITILEASKR